MAVAAQVESGSEVQADLARLVGLVEQGRVEEARHLAPVLAERWPEAAEIQHMARVLAPPVYRLETRPGTPTGSLERLPLPLPAEVGEPLTVEATWFISPDWPGPLVPGWKGVRERFRLALDPGQELFYFGSL